jgi:hypothetical protein
MPAHFVVNCTACGRNIPGGDAHVIINAQGAGQHVLYHSDCCPSDHSKPGHLLAALAAEDKLAGRKRRRRRAA